MNRSKMSDFYLRSGISKSVAARTVIARRTIPGLIFLDLHWAIVFICCCLFGLERRIQSRRRRTRTPNSISSLSSKGNISLFIILLLRRVRRRKGITRRERGPRLLMVRRHRPFRSRQESTDLTSPCRRSGSVRDLLIIRI